LNISPLLGASPEPESEPEILVIKEDKKRVPAGKEAAIEAEVLFFSLVSSTGIDTKGFFTVPVLFTSGS
jgi:hypothetical protein